MTAVAITRNHDIGAAVAEVLGHIEPELLVRGKLVAGKPNGSASAKRSSIVASSRCSR